MLGMLGGWIGGGVCLYYARGKGAQFAIVLALVFAGCTVGALVGTFISWFAPGTRLRMKVIRELKVELEKERRREIEAVGADEPIQREGGGTTDVAPPAAAAGTPPVTTPPAAAAAPPVTTLPGQAASPQTVTPAPTVGSDKNPTDEKLPTDESPPLETETVEKAIRTKGNAQALRTALQRFGLSLDKKNDEKRGQQHP